MDQVGDVMPVLMSPSSRHETDVQGSVARQRITRPRATILSTMYQPTSRLQAGREGAPRSPARGSSGGLRLAVFVAVAMIAGCKSNKRILNPTVERNPVVFESPQGADAFEQALDERYDAGEADIKQLRARLSRNAFFNQQIKVADRDNDGIITDVEAGRYAKK